MSLQCSITPDITNGSSTPYGREGVKRKGGLNANQSGASCGDPRMQELPHPALCGITLSATGVNPRCPGGARVDGLAGWPGGAGVDCLVAGCPGGAGVDGFVPDGAFASPQGTVLGQAIDPMAQLMETAYIGKLAAQAS